MAQSNVGTHIFNYNKTTSKFEFLVPVTGDLPAMGSAPSTLETTEMASEVKTYISDRPDSPNMEFTYNFEDASFSKLKSVLDPNVTTIIAIRLPKGNTFVFPATGDTWLSGGSPINGAFSLAQGGKSAYIGDDGATLTAEQVAELANYGITATTSQSFKELVDWTTIPTNLINPYPA